MLNAIWAGLIIIAILVAVGQALVSGSAEPLKAVVEASFAMAKTGFEIALGLTGVMALWLGFLRVGEAGGAVRWLSRLVAPLFARLFPGVPKDHPASGAIVMNMTANTLGLDNAATPMGIKAMEELQSLNPHKDQATREQILFLVINTSSVTIVPASIFVYRAQAGAANPTDVFVPIVLATFASTMTGFLATAWALKLRILDKVVLAWLLGAFLFVGGLVTVFAQLSPQGIETASAALGHGLILAIILGFVLLAASRRQDLFAKFVEGAREGFTTAVTIIPYLVAMLVAIGMFRASGALDVLLSLLRSAVQALGIDDRFVAGLPTALMKPLSGSGARGMMVETMKAEGADSFAGSLVCVIQGSTETTLYVLATYFGAVGIKRPKQAVVLGLLADLGGITAAILLSYLFFGHRL